MSEFHSAFHQKAKELIPEFLYEQIRSAAIPISGAQTRWKMSAPSIFEKIAIPHLKPDKLKGLQPKELKDVLNRLNRIFQTAKRMKEDTGAFVKAGNWVVQEMRERKIPVDTKLAILQEWVGKSDEEIEKNLEAESMREAPLSNRGYTTDETLQLVQENGKFSKEQANYMERAYNAFKACSGCRFFMRGTGTTGTCQVVEGDVNWYASSDLHICAQSEAQHIFMLAAQAVHDSMLDQAIMAKATEGMGTDDDNNTDPKKPEMEIIKAKIRKRIRPTANGKFEVTDDSGNKVLGTHASRADALRQLAAIERSKIKRKGDKLQSKVSDKVKREADKLDKKGHKDVEKGQPTVGQVHQPGSDKEYDDDEMEKAETKSEGGKKFRSSDYAYVPDPKKPSTWKLRLTNTPGGAPDSGIVGAAAAALGPGFRGQKVQIPSADRAKVKAKVRAAWKKANPDKDPEEMPEALKKEDYTREDVVFDVPIAKIDRKKQKIYGIVLEPDEVDTQDDTVAAEEIEKAAEGFMKRSRTIGLRHRKAARGVDLTDSYVTQGPTKLGKKLLKEGTWIIGVKVKDPALWAGVENGEYRGFSVGGHGTRRNNA